jgi:hypothetical protein
MWQSLLIAAVSAGGAIASILTGAVLTQRQTRRRDDITWERERKRERERWAREDADRTFEHRRDSYVDFYESLRDMTFLVYNFGMGLSEKPDDDSDSLPPDFQLRAYRKLQHLRLYATPTVMAAADDAYNAAWQWGNRVKHDQDEEEFYEDQFGFDQAEEALRCAIRSDLSVPDGPEPSSDAIIDPNGRMLSLIDPVAALDDQ